MYFKGSETFKRSSTNSSSRFDDEPKCICPVDILETREFSTRRDKAKEENFRHPKPMLDVCKSPYSASTHDTRLFNVYHPRASAVVDKGATFKANACIDSESRKQCGIHRAKTFTVSSPLGSFLFRIIWCRAAKRLNELEPFCFRFPSFLIVANITKREERRKNLLRMHEPKKRGRTRGLFDPRRLQILLARFWVATSLALTAMSSQRRMSFPSLRLISAPRGFCVFMSWAVSWQWAHKERQIRLAATHLTTGVVDVEIGLRRQRREVPHARWTLSKAYRLYGANNVRWLCGFVAVDDVRRLLALPQFAADKTHRDYCFVSHSDHFKLDSIGSLSRRFSYCFFRDFFLSVA